MIDRKGNELVAHIEDAAAAAAAAAAYPPSPLRLSIKEIYGMFHFQRYTKKEPLTFP